jgi:hypothetical protein
MTPNATPDISSMLSSNIAIPQHVVYRTFPSETVVLNLETCNYHGLNATAGEMLKALESAACVRDAAAILAERHPESSAAIEADLCELCVLLLERGLVEVDGG